MHSTKLRFRLGTVLAVVSAGLLVGAFPLPSARASCIGPVLSLGTQVSPEHSESPAPAVVRQGEPLVVSGRWFRDGCADTYASSGCGPPRPLEVETPMRDVDLVLRQGGSTWAVGRSTAAGEDAEFAISWRVTLPRQARRGPAVLSAATAEVPVIVR